MKIATLKVYNVNDETGEMTISQTVEIHIMKPGETMERFGGSSKGLVVDKYGSLVTRTYYSHGCGSNFDYETYLHNHTMWNEFLRTMQHSNVEVEWADPPKCNYCGGIDYVREDEKGELVCDDCRRGFEEESLSQ